MKTEKIEGKSLVELKAIVYDLLVEQQTVTQNLQAVNNLIVKKEKEKIIVKKEIKKEDLKDATKKSK